MDDRREEGAWRRIVASVLGAAVLLVPGPPTAQERSAPDPAEPSAETEPEAGGEPSDPEPGSAAGSGARPGSGMIPRAALVDTARAQSSVICASERFLGCMGFDGRECLALSEAAIDQCLMPLPPEIDPSELDEATLEDCPRAVYERAGYAEEAALVCFEQALEEP